MRSSTTKILNMESLKVFYDGSCHLCYREVHYYKKRDRFNLLIPINIKAKEFKASDYGLSSIEVDIHMHATDSQGNIYRGIASFIEIWKRLPGVRYRILTKMAQSTFLRPILDFCYDLFARKIRPKLPKRNCDDHCNL